MNIFWQFCKTDLINEYHLCTMTYGTAAAQFQYLRTVKELINIEKNRSPLAAEIIQNDTFVDDILTGAYTEDDASNPSQLIQLCSQAKFELWKWARNSYKILQTSDTDACAMFPFVFLNNEKDSNLKLLGFK